MSRLHACGHKYSGQMLAVHMTCNVLVRAVPEKLPAEFRNSSSSCRDMTMVLLRTAVGFCPVVGPATDVLDAASSGDRTGCAIAVGRLLVDVGCSGLSQPAMLCARPAGHTAHHVIKVVKHTLKQTLKQKAKNRLREASIKLSLTAAAASAEATISRAKTRQFVEVASADAQAHARLAKQVYRAPSERQGFLACEMVTMDRQTIQGEFWYAYVGGDSRQGFWYCPANGGHLVLAERGTCLSDVQDLGRDACIAIGKSFEALHSRARESLAAMQHQLHCHTARRVTATGHSLGGAVVARLSRLIPLHGVHIFNPGGLPDLHRYITLHSAFAGSALGACKDSFQVHRIAGDAISLGFLPLDQRTYSKKHGLEDVDPHKLLHFLPE